jgi:hypothetical protein
MINTTGYVMLPVCLIGAVFMAVFTPRILARKGGLFRDVRDRTGELITELQVGLKRDSPHSAMFSHLPITEALCSVLRGVPQTSNICTSSLNANACSG